MARKAAQTAPARRNAKTGTNKAKLAPKRPGKASPSATAHKAPKNAPKKAPARRYPVHVSYDVGTSPIYLALRTEGKEHHIVCHRRDFAELSTEQFIGLLEIFESYHQKTRSGRKYRFVKPGVVGRYADWYGVGCVFSKDVNASRIAEKLSRLVEDRFGNDD